MASIVPDMVGEVFAPADIKQEGLRMIAAIEEEGFDLASYNVLEPDLVPDGIAESAYQALLAGMKTDTE